MDRKNTKKCLLLKHSSGFYFELTCYLLPHWFDCFLHLLIRNYHLQILLLHDWLLLLLLLSLACSWCASHIHVRFIPSHILSSSFTYWRWATGSGGFEHSALKTDLLHRGGLKKARNQDLRTKKEVIPSPVSSLSSHKLYKNKYFLSSLKLLVRGSLHLLSMFSPGPVVIRRGIDSRVSRVARGSTSPLSISISGELKPSPAASEANRWSTSRSRL